MKANESSKLDASMLAYRKKHSKVEVVLARHPLEPGEITLSVTHNGYQWASIGLLPDEAKEVIDKLSEFINYRP